MKQFPLFAFLSFFAFAAHAQVSLIFCVEVDSIGNCINQTSEFSIEKNGGTISFLLRNDNGLGTDKVLYKIFSVSDIGVETFVGSLDQETGKDWTYAWEDAVLYDEGQYRVKVYDASKNESFICSSIFKVIKE